MQARTGYRPSYQRNASYQFPSCPLSVRYSTSVCRGRPAIFGACPCAAPYSGLEVGTGLLGGGGRGSPSSPGRLARALRPAGMLAKLCSNLFSVGPGFQGRGRRRGFPRPCRASFSHLISPVALPVLLSVPRRTEQVGNRSTAGGVPTLARLRPAAQAANPAHPRLALNHPWPACSSKCTRGAGQWPATVR